MFVVVVNVCYLFKGVKKFVLCDFVEYWWVVYCVNMLMWLFLECEFFEVDICFLLYLFEMILVFVMFVLL